MIAKIISAEKQTIPRYNNETEVDEPTIMVVTKVEFYKDNGDLYYTQSYAQRPEDMGEDPTAYFKAQAVVMQKDLDDELAHEQDHAASELADKIVEQLNQPNSNA